MALATKSFSDSTPRLTLFNEVLSPGLCQPAYSRPNLLGRQHRESHIAPVSRLVELQLVDQVPRQVQVLAVALVGAPPGEHVLEGVVAQREAAGSVWFDWRTHAAEHVFQDVITLGEDLSDCRRRGCSPLSSTWYLLISTTQG